jgi:VanZ family protein
MQWMIDRQSFDHDATAQVTTNRSPFVAPAPPHRASHEISSMNSKPIVWLLALLSVFLVVLLSVIPGDLQIRTGAPKDLEHFMAYLGVGAILAYAFGPSRRAQLVVIFLVILAGCLETIQHWVPGRTPDIADWLASALGAVAGVAVAHLWTRARARRRSSQRAREPFIINAGQ